MTQADVLRLVAFIMSYDRRKQSDADIIAYGTAANIGRWTFPLAMAAVAFHFTHTREWIMPADITRIITERRHAARAAYVQPAPPPEFADDTTTDRYLAWARADLEQHMSARMDEFVGILPPGSMKMVESPKFLELE